MKKYEAMNVCSPNGCSQPPTAWSQDVLPRCCLDTGRTPMGTWRRWNQDPTPHLRRQWTLKWCRISGKAWIRQRLASALPLGWEVVKNQPVGKICRSINCSRLDGYTPYWLNSYCLVTPVCPNNYNLRLQSSKSKPTNKHQHWDQKRHWFISIQTSVALDIT